MAQSLSNALVPTAEAILKTFGDDVGKAILQGAGVQTVGKVTAKQVSNALARELVVDGVLVIILTGADVVDNLESTATDLPLSANMGRELKENLSTKLSFVEIAGTKNITANSTTTYTLDKLPIVMYFYINKGNNALYTLPVLMNTYGRAVADDIQINFTYNNNTKVLTVTCNIACNLSMFGLVR
jgi:hypothetical protein